METTTLMAVLGKKLSGTPFLTFGTFGSSMMCPNSKCANRCNGAHLNIYHGNSNRVAIGSLPPWKKASTSSTSPHQRSCTLSKLKSDD